MVTIFQNQKLDLILQDSLAKLDESTPSPDFQSVLKRSLTRVSHTRVSHTVWMRVPCVSVHCTCVVCNRACYWALSPASRPCHNKWTASASPAPRCDWFSSLSVSPQEALFPQHAQINQTHFIIVIHSRPLFAAPVSEDVKIEERQMEGRKSIPEENQRVSACE